MAIEQKKYGNLDLEIKEPDVVVLIQSEREDPNNRGALINECNVILIEREKISALIKLLKTQLK